MVMKNYERAKNLLKKNIKSLKGIAAALEKETLDGNEIEGYSERSEYQQHKMPFLLKMGDCKMLHFISDQIFPLFSCIIKK